jgi:release factor glutamine methyltransferase
LIPPLDQFDVLACNPPYVSAAEYETLDKNVKDYEPRIALYAGEGGLDLYRRIADKVEPFLKPDGILLLEIGYSQGAAVRELLEQAGVFADIRFEKDLQKHDRIIVARRTPA